MIGLNSVLRASDVKRWHIVNTSRQQNLAEHQWKVAVLSGEIAERMRMKKITINAIMAYAMFHDIAEVRTGDIPTPTKKVIANKTGVNIDKIFSVHERMDISNCPELVQKIIKCADHLDGAMFLKDHKVGRHADQVYELILKDANLYFDQCGEVGKIARSIWRDHMEVQYSI